MHDKHIYTIQVAWTHNHRCPNWLSITTFSISHYHRWGSNTLLTFWQYRSWVLPCFSQSWYWIVVLVIFASWSGLNVTIIKLWLALCDSWIGGLRHVKSRALIRNSRNNVLATVVKDLVPSTSQLCKCGSDDTLFVRRYGRWISSEYVFISVCSGRAAFNS